MNFSWTISEGLLLIEVAEWDLLMKIMKRSSNISFISFFFISLHLHALTHIRNCDAFNTKGYTSNIFLFFAFAQCSANSFSDLEGLGHDYVISITIRMYI